MQVAPSQKIVISKFKATCLGLLEKIRSSGRPLVVTKQGKPIALVSLPPVARGRESAFGALKAETIVVGDIVTPLAVGDWEIYKT